MTTVSNVHEKEKINLKIEINNRIAYNATYYPDWRWEEYIKSLATNEKKASKERTSPSTLRPYRVEKKIYATKENTAA